jgi:hypothetical protein
MKIKEKTRIGRLRHLTHARDIYICSGWGWRYTTRHMNIPKMQANQYLGYLLNAH